MKTFKIKCLAVLLFAMTAISCESTRTAIFDQYSYQKTTELKVETTRLIDKATTPYSKNTAEVEALLLNIEKLTEYEKNKPDNEITFAMWTVLSDQEKNLLGGFFRRWREKETLSPVFVSESKKQVVEALDLLIQYEIKKDKASKENLIDLINLKK